MILQSSLSRLLCFFLFSLGLITVAQAGSYPKRYDFKNGILDLRSHDIDNVPVELQGDWQFYWNQLLEPNQESKDFEYKPFPKLWSDLTWKNKPIPSQGFATYRLTIYLPPHRSNLAVLLPDVYTSCKLFVNGRLIAKTGEPGISEATTKPYWNTKVRPIYFGADTLKLELQMANFSHHRGGSFKNIIVGNNYMIDKQRSMSQFFDVFLSGGIFMGGLFFLGLYLFGKHDKPILYFSLFCVVYSYRVVGTSPYFLHDVVPYLNWLFYIRLEYLTLYISVALFALYTRALYPEDAPQKVLSIMTAICGVYGLVTLVTPSLVFTSLINSFLFILIGYVLFAGYVYWNAFRHNRTGATYSLASSVSIFVVTVAIVLEYYGWGSPVQGATFAGYIFFFFCQSLILSFKFASTLKIAKDRAEQGLKSKSEFLSTMSHEIRTPLNSVIGITHLMIKEEPRPDQKERLDVMLFSANNLLTIVNDILDFSAIEAGKIHFQSYPVDLRLLSQNIMSGYMSSQTGSDVKFLLEIDSKLPDKVLGDITRISQVLGNLVHNAVKFTSQGYVKLKLEVKNITAMHVTIRLSVEDTGIGIPEEKQQLIFERFTQVDSSTSRGFSGTGLGLAISKRLLEAQGIELELKSKENEGSEFYFTQTFEIMSTKEPDIQQQQSETNADSLKGVRILIVEDNRMNVLVLDSFLKKWGATSEVASNGHEGVNKLNTSVHDIILMDLHMPVMDGYEATKVLRDRGETIPIIALTASLALETEEKLYSIGVTDVVIKPFNPDELLVAIQKHLAR